MGNLVDYLKEAESWEKTIERIHELGSEELQKKFDNTHGTDIYQYFAELSDEQVSELNVAVSSSLMAQKNWEEPMSKEALEKKIRALTQIAVRQIEEAGDLTDQYFKRFNTTREEMVRALECAAERLP